LIFAIFTFIYMNWLKYKVRHIINASNNKEKNTI
jgi:hypothetical protein